MSLAPDSPSGDEVESRVRARTTELSRSNEKLREELRQLHQTSAELLRRLHEATLGRQTDREIRRATLNLLEDAVEAHTAEQEENAKRRRIEEELRQANRRKDEFLATLAHELRNPLVPIRNCLHLLRFGGLDGPAVARACEMMERQVNHVVRLVDDLMEVSRITRGRIELRKEPVELAAVVQNAVEISKPLIEAGRHQFTLRLPPEPLVLDADPVRMAQLLSNLLNNAAKYTNEGGQVGLTAWREGSNVLVSVKDNGIGIAADMLPTIFDTFTQANRTYDRVQGGLGIGLTLVRSLVEMHGGSVEAWSEGLGRGSEFVVRLPLRERPAKREVDRRASRSTALSHRILVVDDNSDAAESVGMVLQLLGADAAHCQRWPGRSGGDPLFSAGRGPARRGHAGNGRSGGRPADAPATRGPGPGPDRPDGLGPGGRSAQVQGGWLRPPPGQAGESGRLAGNPDRAAAAARLLRTAACGCGNRRRAQIM